MKIKRTITRDYKNDCLIIKGDCAPNSISIFLVKNIYEERDYGIFLTEATAKDMANYLNKQKHTNTFITIERTLFAE